MWTFKKYCEDSKGHELSCLKYTCDIYNWEDFVYLV